MKEELNIVIIGLSISSSWGNGHATTFRGLVKALNENGHRVTFLERDVPWYAAHRDLPEPDFCRLELYHSLQELQLKYADLVENADMVMVGSYVPDGIAVGKWVTDQAKGVSAFYDIDTPITISAMRNGICEYIHAGLITAFDMYLSFTGGPVLRQLEEEFGSPMSRALYCSFDPRCYFPERHAIKWELGYLGTYSTDRQPGLEELLLKPANTFKHRSFIVAGPQYPENISWPRNVERVEHLPPKEHRKFYNSQRFTLNITRADMKAAGHSPSVRLFEAAACGVPIISDYWEGIETFFEPGKEILIARTAADVEGYLRLSKQEAEKIGANAMSAVWHSHKASNRATELEKYLKEAQWKKKKSAAMPGYQKK